MDMKGYEGSHGRVGTKAAKGLWCRRLQLAPDLIDFVCCDRLCSFTLSIYSLPITYTYPLHHSHSFPTSIPSFLSITPRPYGVASVIIPILGAARSSLNSPFLFGVIYHAGYSL